MVLRPAVVNREVGARCAQIKNHLSSIIISAYTVKNAASVQNRFYMHIASSTVDIRPKDTENSIICP